MPIRIGDPKLQQLVDQMTQGGQKIKEQDVHTLIDAAYADDNKLSSTERKALRDLLAANENLFESPAAREKLATFNRMQVTSIQDAAHRFAADGRIDNSEAGQIRDLVNRDGRVSSREKVTLKALLGFYSPQMEPGAKDLVAGLAGVSVTPPPGPTPNPGPTTVLGAGNPRFETHLSADGVLSPFADRAPRNAVETGDGLYRAANLIDGLPADKNLFAGLSVEQRTKLFGQLQDALKQAPANGSHNSALNDKQALQMRSSAATTLLHLAESLPNTGSGADLKKEAEGAYLAATKAETNPVLRDSMIYNLNRVADHLTPTAKTEAKSLFTETAPLKPPYEDWFKNGNDTVNIAWHPGQGSEGFYRGTVEMLKNKGFKPEGAEREGGPAIYAKTIKNREGVETTFRIHVKEYNQDLFDKMDDPKFQIVGYDGHSDIGRTVRNSLENAPASDDKKLIFYGLCAGKDNIHRVREKYPDSQIMTTFNSSYFRTSEDASGRNRMVESENLNALMETVEGIANRSDWQEIRTNIQRDAIPYYWKSSHALPDGMNYVTPIDTAIRRRVLDSDFDGQIDSLDKLANFNTFDVRTDTRTEFKPIDPGKPADQINGENIHIAANSLNTAVNYNPFTNQYNDLGRVAGGGYFEGSPSDPIVKFEKANIDGQDGWVMNVNKHYSHISEEALRAVSMFEWNEQLYRDNPALYESRWKSAAPYGERNAPSAADRKLMGMTLATFTLAYDMQSGAFGPHRRDNEIWNQLLEKYNLPTNLEFRPIFGLIDQEHHDYAGSPKIVSDWKKSIPADQLSQIR